MTELHAPIQPGGETTIHLVPHFHFDPVWWNTQAASTSELSTSDWSGSPRMRFQRSAFEVLRAHLDRATTDADYRFCVAEVDYLEPYWTRHPEDRSLIRRLLDEERLEVVGGTYNEPSTNLTSRASTRRNLAEGLAFQRGVLGAAVSTAWQLDVFGHDPSFPSDLVAAGLDSVVLARGPYGPWGPMLSGGFDRPRPPTGVQFPSEFTWIAPDGAEVTCAYLAAHYSTGYRIDEAASIDEAGAFIFELAAMLSPVAASSHVMILIGTDSAPPARWTTDLVRRFPKIRCSLPRHFLAAVRDELVARRRSLTPQTRDLNPIYTGKDVSYIDTKQAQCAIESALEDAAAFGAVASSTDEAWRLAVFAAHHDALTGTESDQVYLDLLAGWRRAFDVAAAARRDAVAAGTPSGAVAVANPLEFGRRDHVAVEVRRESPLDEPCALLDEDGNPVPAVYDNGLVSTVLDVTAGGRRTLRPVSDPNASGWTLAVGSTAIFNEHHRLVFDRERGGGIASWRRRPGSDELVAPGRVAGELTLLDEYATHPDHGEGPWHLLPRRARHRSSEQPATVEILHSTIGQRARVRGLLGPTAFVLTATLWQGIDRLDVVVDLDPIPGTDHLVRISWPLPVPGAMPVVSTGGGPIGRGFASLDGDAAMHPWTLETPSSSWFGASIPCRVDVAGTDGTWSRAISIAEVIVDSDRDADLARAKRLVTALASRGVTATTTIRDGPRYGMLGLDSNAPDVRIRLLTSARPTRTWEPAAEPLRTIWQPVIDVRGDASLPTLVVSGIDAVELDREVEAVAAELSTTGAFGASYDGVATAVMRAEHAHRRTVAIAHRGTPSCAVETDGTLVSTLLRASSAWPAGQWIDPPRRTAPDGSSFQSQHWSHRFELAVLLGDGDWREARIVERALAFARPLVAASEPRPTPSPPIAPTFSRHWVQGRGPAPTPRPPVSVHLHPPADFMRHAGRGRWRLSVAAAAHLDRPHRCDLRLDLPSGWSGELADGHLVVVPGGWSETVAFLEPPESPPAGHHVVRGFDAIGASWDEHIVSVAAHGPPLEWDGAPPHVELDLGERADVEVALRNNTTAVLWAELDVLSPWGSWPLVPTARQRFELAPGTSKRSIRFEGVAAPAGRWWWLVRAIAGPIVAYSPSARLTLRT